jgi:hypothetical protein
MLQEVPLTRKSDFAGRVMTVICCLAVLITVTAVGSDEPPQPGVRNAINLLGGKRKHANFAKELAVWVRGEILKRQDRDTRLRGAAFNGLHRGSKLDG